MPHISQKGQHCYYNCDVAVIHCNGMRVMLDYNNCIITIVFMYVCNTCKLSMQLSLLIIFCTSLSLSVKDITLILICLCSAVMQRIARMLKFSKLSNFSLMAFLWFNFQGYTLGCQQYSITTFTAILLPQASIMI